MSEHIPFFDWVDRHAGSVISIIVAIVAGLYALTHLYKLSVDKELIDVRTEVDEELRSYRHDMKNLWGIVQTHSGSIITLQSEQKHTVLELTEIKTTMRDINGKLDAVTKDIAAVLFTVRGRGE